jgi:hypothetical protein
MIRLVQSEALRSCKERNSQSWRSAPANPLCRGTPQQALQTPTPNPESGNRSPDLTSPGDVKLLV